MIENVVSELFSAGLLLTGWEVFSMELDDISSIADTMLAPHQASDLQAATARRLLAGDAGATRASAGPAFFRGSLVIEGEAARRTTNAGGISHLPDTYLNLETRGWAKGVAWVNGFNLGWFWPAKGPQMTLYVPGPVLREGDNEVVLLEVEEAPASPAGECLLSPLPPAPSRRPLLLVPDACARAQSAVVFTDEPNFYGPRGPAPGGPPAAEQRNQGAPRQRVP